MKSGVDQEFFDWAFLSLVRCQASSRRCISSFVPREYLTDGIVEPLTVRVSGNVGDRLRLKIAFSAARMQSSESFHSSNTTATSLGRMPKMNIRIHVSTDIRGAILDTKMRNFQQRNGHENAIDPELRPFVHR
jgi:hypothetical protein